MKLQVQDYQQIGLLLKKQFENRVAAGLEGGYAFENKELGKAIEAFGQAWQS